MSAAPPKCFHCGSASHKSFSCGYRQQQQQQQQFRNPTPQTMQNQNWGPSNQNYGNSQPNQSNYARGSGQSGNAGYSRGGYNNNAGYNDARNTGYSNNNPQQSGYGNSQRGQSNFAQRGQLTNRPMNMGNRQPQNQQRPQAGYGVRVLQINPSGPTVGGADDDTLDPNPEEIELCGQDQYEQMGSQDEHYIEPKYNGGYMIYPNDGSPGQVQNGAESL
ncbi:MAG: hypothetical protein GY820_18065 [Gammaproteobacteria bacterium]|nr:hypothetical protein [Gammaproteobacteria bacterium]